MNLYKISALLSLLGVGLIFTLIMFSYPHYIGFLGEDYSFAQHFISELGNPYKNDKHYLLNYGFIIIGLLFIPMIISLAYHTQNKIGYIAGFLALLGMIALCLVGFVPEHHVKWHTPIALIFFALTSCSVLIFSILSLTHERIPRFLFLPSILPAILFTIFLFYPKTELYNIVGDPWHYVRPDIVWLAVFEWLFFLTMSFWIICVSIYLWNTSK